MIKEGKQKKRIKEKRRPGSSILAQEIIRLTIKIIVILTLGYAVLTFIYGVARYSDDSMFPAVKAGDVVLFYRLNKKYVASDVLVLEYEGHLQVRRVIAVEGDTVDITEEGLVINGSLQVEQQIYEDTEPYVEGIDFPVTVENGQVFVLGDKRTVVVDSRSYGPVEISDTLGKVITVLRRRNI